MDDSGRGRDGGDAGDGAEDDYGWLYGSRGRSRDASSGRSSGPSEDADPTQVIRLSGGSGSSGSSGRGAGPDDEQTQVIRTGGARGSRPPVDPDDQQTQVIRSGGSPRGAEKQGRYSGPPPERRTSLADARGRGTQDRPARTPGGPGSPRRSRRSTARRVRRALLLLVLAWLVFLIAVPLYSFSQVPRVPFEPAGDRPSSQPGTTYLVVGNDGRGDLTRKQRRRLSLGPEDVGQRTDTILLLHVGSGPNLLLSVPRDSLVEVPGYGVTKINAAYAYGGAPLLTETIERNTGIRIDDYVEIGLLGLVELVDAVDGITVCPTEPIVDPLANLKIRKGCSEVNGLRALGYARSRKTSTLGDIDRARRQREVVSSIGSELMSPRTVLDPFRYWAVGQAGSQAIAVGEGTGPFALGRFAFAMTRVNGENGLTCSVPIADLEVNWDPERAPRMFRLIAEDRTEDIGRQLCSPSGLAGVG